jgi:gas vesicle protein
MKNNIYLFACRVGCVAGLLLLSACSEKNETSQATTTLEKSAEKVSVFGTSTEEKVDDFLTDYVKDLKSALAEADDKKAAAKIQQMKEKYAPRAEKLKAEVETWEASLTEEEKKAFEERADDKPYLKDLITLSFSAMSRVTKSPELHKAFEDLNSQMNILNEDYSSEETTGEEYPEDVVDEETKNE